MTQLGTTAVPPRPYKGKVPRRILLQRALIALGVLSVLTAIGSWAWVKHSWNLDDQAQRNAVAAYMADVQRSTKGVLKNDPESFNAFDGYADGQIYFRVVLGNCSNVRAAIESPTARPSSKGQLHTLRIEMPGLSGKANEPAAYQAVDPATQNWMRPLQGQDGGLSHCFPKK